MLSFFRKLIPHVSLTFRQELILIKIILSLTHILVQEWIHLLLLLSVFSELTIQRRRFFINYLFIDIIRARLSITYWLVFFYFRLIFIFFHGFWSEVPLDTTLI